MISKLKEKKYSILILIVVLTIGIIIINNISHIDRFKGLVKIDNATVNAISASVNESNVQAPNSAKGYDQIDYKINYKLDENEDANQRKVLVRATLNELESKYASFKELNSDNITSTLSEDKKSITIEIENVEQAKENTILLSILLKGAPNGLKINPKIEIKESTEENYNILGVNEIEVKTNSIKGEVRQENGKTLLSNIELKLLKDDKEVKRTYSDENGSYTFSDIEPGNYIVEVVEDNYELVSAKDVKLDDEAILNIFVKNVKPFSLDTKKYITKVKIVNNSKENEYTYGELEKVNQSIKNIKDLHGEIIYKVKVKNTGKKAGVVTLVKENIPVGLSFNSEKNPNWSLKNGYIYNRSLEGITIAAGEEKEIKLVLDIDKTDEAKAYLNKVKVMGEVYEKVVYILDNKIYKEDEVLEGEKIEELKIETEGFDGWYTDKNYTNKYNFNNEVTKDLILYGKTKQEEVKKYNVIFVDEGNIISSKKYEEGSLIVSPADPKKEGYTFDGWYEGENKYDLNEPVTRDLTLESKYKINKYKITFKNYDGSILQETTEEYNTLPVYNGETPTRENTAEYTYEFNDWSPQIQKVTDNQQYIATYTETKRKYTITFIDEGKSTEQILDYGSVVTKPVDPKKEGYTFTGWYEENESDSYNFPITVTKNLTLYSRYEINKFTVKFFDKDVEIEEFKQEVEYKEVAKEPELSPTLEDYKFMGWVIRGTDIPYVFGTPVTEDIELESIFTKKPTYLVTFNIEGDIDILSPQQVIEGKKATRPEDPIKDGYVFDGWYTDNTYSTEYDFDNKVTGNIELYGRYIENAHTITYINESSTWEVEKVLDTYKAQGPTKGNPSKLGYTFLYWSLENNGEEYKLNTYPVTENITLYAVYEINKYEVVFKNNDGSVLERKEVEYGNIPAYNGSTPIRVSTEEELKEFTYTFIGWDKEIVEVTENQEYIATYSETKNKYKVTFINNDGTELQSENLEYGSMPLYKGDTPERVSTDEELKQNIYTFIGWDKEIVEVTESKVYVANYEEVPVLYGIEYYDGETGELIEGKYDIEYNTTLENIKEEINKDYKIFLGWYINNGDEKLTNETKIIEKPLKVYSKYEKVEKPVVTHTPTEWTRDNVVVTIENPNHPEYNYIYKIDEGEYKEYVSPFEIPENCTIVAKSIKNNVESDIEIHEITNIDRIKPTIRDFDEDEITPTSFNISFKAKDNESGLSQIKILKNDEEIFTEDYDTNLNEEKQINNYVINNLEENTTYNIKVIAIDKVLNESEVFEKDITTSKKIIVARIIGRENSLYDDENDYENFESLEGAINACPSGQCTIQMVLDTTESVEVLDGQDITFDLNGKVVTGKRDYTIQNSGEFIVIDNSVEIGAIVNTNSTAINNIDLGTLQIGINEEPLVVSTSKPNIVGNSVGISNGNNSTLKFYDGRIEGLIAITGQVNETPYLYNAKVDTGTTQVATLQILAEAEARINTSTYYTKIADAMSETNSGRYTEEEQSGNFMSLAYTPGIYGFNYNEEEGTLTSNNYNVHNSVANSYIKIDLTNYTENQQLVINAEVSSQSNYDFGYATITKDKNVPSYDSEDGRFIYISGNTNGEYSKVLEKGKVYYLHLGYRKNDSGNSYSDIFKINSIKLRNIPKFEITEENYVSPSNGTYGFDYDETLGTLTSNNKGIDYSVANAYIKVDMTEEDVDRTLKLNAEVSTSNSAYGYVTVTNSEAVPAYNNSNGRYVYVYGSSIGDYEITLKAGQVNYIHIGYKRAGGNHNNDFFRINFIGNPGDYIFEHTNKKDVPVLNEEVDTIQLLKDITLTSPLEVEEVKDVVLDLNGKTLTTSANDYVIKNNGNLKVIDSKYDYDNKVLKDEYEALQAQYDREYAEEQARYNEEYESDLQKYNELKEIYDLNPKDPIDIDLKVANFTYQTNNNSYSSMSQGNNFISTTTYGGNNQSVTYYNEKINVESFINIKGVLDYNHNYSEGFELGKVYIGLSKTNDNSIDDFTEYVSYNVNNRNSKLQDFELSTYEPGEYYIKMVVCHSEFSENTVYSKINNLKLQYEPIEPTRKQAVKKIATISKPEQTGNILSTTNSAILNNTDSNLVIEQGVINLNKQGNNNSVPNAIDNNGSLTLKDDVVINIDNTFSNAIYNYGYGSITTRNTIINLNNDDQKGIYNKSTKNQFVNNLTINMIDNKSRIYGIYNESTGDFNLDNTNINGESSSSYSQTCIYNASKGNINVSNSTLITPEYATNNLENSGAITLNSVNISSKSTSSSDLIRNNSLLNINDVNIDTKRRYNLRSMRNSTTNIKNSTFTSTYSTSSDDQFTMYTNGLTTIENTDINVQNMGGISIGDDAGDILLKNTNISSGNTAVYMSSNNANLAISGGNIISSNSSAISIHYNNKMPLTLGSKDSDNPLDIPYIEGKKYGIFRETSSSNAMNASPINYYDGIIIGGNGTAVYNSISDIPDEYAINIEKIDSKEKMTLVRNDDVAKVGSVTYKTLKDAVDSIKASDETEVTLLKDIYIVDSINIDEGKNIKLNFNGHNIKSYAESNFINNNGTLSIVDTKSNETKLEGYTNNLINNNGTMTVSNITIENLYDYRTTILNSGNFELLNNAKINRANIYPNGINNKGTFKVINTTIINDSILNDTNAELIINNGNVNVVGNSINNYNLIINNGNINIDSSIIGTAITNYNIYGIENNNTGTLNITSSSILGINGIRNSGNGTIKDTTIGSENNAYNGQTKYAIEVNGGNLTLEDNTVNANDCTINMKKSSIVNIKNGIYVKYANNNNNTIELTNGTLNIDGATITSNNISYVSYPIRIKENNNQILNITSGILKQKNSNYYALDIESNNATVTIGVKDDAINNDLVLIEGGKYGLYNLNTSIVNFYDGVISGFSEAIYGGISDIEVGYEIIKEKYSEDNVNKEKAYLMRLPVAQIKSTGEKYYNLQDAINAVNVSKDTIEMIRNITVLSTADPTIVPADKDIIIDMKGFEIKANNDNFITNNGILEITDSTSGLSDGTLDTTSTIESASTNVILNNGTLKIGTTKVGTAGNSSTIVNNGDMEIVGGYIYNLSADSRNVKVIINNQNKTLIIKNSDIEVGSDITSIDNSGTLNISNNTSLNSRGSWATAIVNQSTGNLNINNAKITGFNLAIDNLGNSEIEGLTNGTNNRNNSTCANNKNYMNIKNSTSYCSKISNNANMIIDGGNHIFTTGYNSDNSNQGTLTIKNSANITGRLSNESEATLNIESGSIDSKENSSIAIENKGVVNVGIKGDVDENGELLVSIDNPAIKGVGYGIFNRNNGTINFYDGIIMGKNAAISGSVNEIEDNYSIYRELQDSYNCMYLKKEPAAKLLSKEDIESNYYYSLQEALDAAKTTDTIEILRDLNITSSMSSIVVPEGKNITLDLAGYEIVASNSDSIINNGSLNIIDSSASISEDGQLQNLGTGLIRNTNDSYIVIKNNSQLTSNISIDGKIENIGTYTVNNGKITKQLLSDDGTTLNINNGTISRMESLGTVNIYGGTIYEVDNGDNNHTNSILNITGGDVRTIRNYGSLKIEGIDTSIECNIIGYSTVSDVTINNSNYNNLSIQNVKSININGGNYSNLSVRFYTSSIKPTFSIENSTINGGSFDINGITTIKGTTFTDSFNFVNNGNLTIDNSNINMKSNTLLSAGGTVNIKNSSEINKTYNNSPAIRVSGILNVLDNSRVISSGTAIELDNIYSVVNIGEKGNNVGFEPTIIGTNYGINNINGNVNFYDGTIKGNISISGQVNEVEPGYKIVNSTDESGLKVSTLGPIGEADRVAGVNGINYGSIKDAIRSVPTNGIETGVATNVILYSNTSLNENITVKDGQNIKFYLNGFSLDYNGYSFVTEGSGKIELLDGSASTTALGNIVNTVKEVLNIEQVTKNIVIYEMDDGSKLEPNKTYILYKLEDDKYSAVKMSEEEQIGKYTQGNSIKEMNVIRGRLYLNNLPKGDYKLVDSDGKETSFSINSEGKIFGHVRELVQHNEASVIATATAEFIISIQTGVASSGLIILFTLIMVIGILLYLIKRQEKSLL